MTPWGVRGSFRRVLRGGCDAEECERQLRRILEGGFDAVRFEKQFETSLGNRM